MRKLALFLLLWIPAGGQNEQMQTTQERLLHAFTRINQLEAKVAALEAYRDYQRDTNQKIEEKLDSITPELVGREVLEERNRTIQHIQTDHEARLDHLESGEHLLNLMIAIVPIGAGVIVPFLIHRGNRRHGELKRYEERLEAMEKNREPGKP